MSDFLPESPMPQQPAYGQPQQPAYGQPQQPAYGQPQQPAYGQPQPPALPSTPQAYSTSATEGRPWIVAIIAALGAGAVLAFAYAAISYTMDTEFLVAVMAIGAVIGWVVRVVGGRPGMLSGVIAVLVAVPATLAAVILLVVFYAAGSIPEGISAIGDVNYSVAVQAYFSDVLAYVWFAASIVFAFLGGVKAKA